jgi:hypothetical protein
VSGQLDEHSIATLSRISKMIPGALSKDPLDVANVMENALGWLHSADTKKEFIYI